LKPESLRSARRTAGLTQQQAASRLGVSQAYLALIEGGRRPVTGPLRRRLVKLYRLGPTALPTDAGNPDAWGSSKLSAALAGLGYPGFRQPGARQRNPASVLLSAVTAPDMEVRILEATPWLAAQFPDLDWEWLIREAKVRDAQNRLGFVVTLAAQVAEQRGNTQAALRLREIEGILDRARLVREDTLCQEALSDAERRWLRTARPPEAAHWNLLTDLRISHLPYAA
jgi:transcriptional regulator with XRE-family HTH domain